MLACRLCLAFGVQDPEQWLEECPRRVLNLWRAFAVAEGWFTERYLAALSAVSLKKLLALKHEQDARPTVLKDVDEVANKYMPADWQWSEEKKRLDPEVLKVMDRGGKPLATPCVSAEIEVDPWQQP